MKRSFHIALVAVIGVSALGMFTGGSLVGLLRESVRCARLQKTGSD